MVDRVRKPAKHTDTLSYLKDHVGVFASFKDIMVFAAALGFSRKKSVAFDKSSEPIPLSVFRGEYDEAFMNVLALFEHQDSGYLEPQGDKFDTKIKLFEEYACGGLDIIKSTIIDPGLDAQSAIISLILDEQAEHTIIDDITALGA
ncbi:MULTISPECIES: DNA phosphorothioation-associated protein 4 [Pseudomonas]|uniref:DNA phosphorothioation-associated protein 4 n=1 Tax=Pseudomonas TaxID=286 RepID=UPI001BCEC797|nr:MULTISPECIES: DNA phosphorothioation-associated protein 4 [Pseudomonas]MBS7463065.1 DNA phosphorothioation-associated protein 4 [Pseudomonas syringae]MCM2460202.1 DNA phosphorothioation-associated protein 4 [Pseudomonas sp. CG7]